MGRARLCEKDTAFGEGYGFGEGHGFSRANKPLKPVAL